MKANRMYWYSWALLMTEATKCQLEIPLNTQRQSSKVQLLARSKPSQMFNALQTSEDVGESKNLENLLHGANTRPLSDLRSHGVYAETSLPSTSPDFLASSTTSSSLKLFHRKNAWTHGSQRTFIHWTSRSYKLMKNWLKDLFSKVYSLVKRLGSNITFRRKGHDPPKSGIRSSKNVENMDDDEDIYYDAQPDFETDDLPARTDISIPKEHVQDPAVVHDEVFPSGEDLDAASFRSLKTPKQETPVRVERGNGNLNRNINSHEALKEYTNKIKIENTYITYLKLALIELSWEMKKGGREDYEMVLRLLITKPLLMKKALYDTAVKKWTVRLASYASKWDLDQVKVHQSLAQALEKPDQSTVDGFNNIWKSLQEYQDKHASELLMLKCLLGDVIMNRIHNFIDQMKS